MPSTFFGLSIASTGLNAFNASVNTTAHNISNANTAGYSKQTVNLKSGQAVRVAAKYGSQGTGVSADSVTQMRDKYYDEKYWNNQSNYGQYDKKYYYMKQVETYFTDNAANPGFTTLYTEMFNALNALQANSGDTSARMEFISDAKKLTNYFNDMSAKLEELQEQLKTMAETEGLASIEIPTEIAEGVPFKVVKPLVITNVDDRQLTLEGEVESTEAVDQYKAVTYGYLVAYDKDGKPFSVGQHGNYAPEGSKLNWPTGTKGKLTIYLSVAAFNIDGLARLGKLLIVDSKAEELKQAAAAMSELQSAAMEKAQKALEKMKK